MSTGRIHVIGAGLAGLSAAVALAEKGAAVTLIEGAGHRPEMENPAEFDRIVCKFLAA